MAEMSKREQDRVRAEIRANIDKLEKQYPNDLFKRAVSGWLNDKRELARIKLEENRLKQELKQLQEKGQA